MINNEIVFILPLTWASCSSFSSSLLLIFLVIVLLSMIRKASEKGEGQGNILIYEEKLWFRKNDKYTDTS